MTEQLWSLDTLETLRVPHDEGGDGVSVIESGVPTRLSQDAPVGAILPRGGEKHSAKGPRQRPLTGDPG